VSAEPANWTEVEKVLRDHEKDLTDRLPVISPRSDTAEALKKKDGRFRWPNN
jgi:hypothetical protein